jgi:hypothetical protein
MPLESQNYTVAHAVTDWLAYGLPRRSKAMDRIFKDSGGSGGLSEALVFRWKLRPVRVGVMGALRW